MFSRAAVHRADNVHFGDDLLPISLRHALKIELLPSKHLAGKIYQMPIPWP